MKTMYKLLILGFALNVSSVFAYNERSGSGIDQGSNGQKGSGVEHEKGAGCSPANTRLTMEFNAVSCQLETGGLLFLDRANGLATYRVPKTGLASAIYAGSLWMGGVDVNGQLKLAAVLYRQVGNDFWPGPLSTTLGTGNYDPHQVQSDSARRDYGDANIAPEVCLAYDKIYTIRKAEVIQFITWWQCSPNNPTPPTGGCTEPIDEPDSDVMLRIENWPGNPTPGIGDNLDQYLAPFYDNPTATNGLNGEYNAIDDGDYPWYDDIVGRDDILCGRDRRVSLFGDETHWWVFNDKGNIHTETSGDPIGMEIRAQAFAFATDDEVNNMTFYNYELINRGTQTLDSTFFAQYIDADLGGYSDDYVGCDVSRGLGYTYNGDNFDQTVSGKPGYGANPPAIGVDFFEGPYQNADGVDNPLVSATTPNATSVAIAAGGIVYGGIGTGYGDTIPDNERFGMRRFTYYTSTAQASQSDPSAAIQFYNYMKGKWRYGDAMVYGGTGFPGSSGATSIHSDYMFPNDSDTLKWATGGIAVPYTVWSEHEPSGPGSTPNPSGDRRFVQAAGPFTLRPGAVNNITVGIVYGRGTGGDLFSSVEAMERADTKAQALFDNCFKILEPPTAPQMDITELSNELIMVLTNPPSSLNYKEEYTQKDINIVPFIDDTIPADQYYHFEGYQIYQMVNSETSAADLDDRTKARMVAQCDIKNGVGKLVNFEFDEALGFSIPVEKVDGEDNGIRHSFRILNDAFASGDQGLVNYKTYYFMAVAYGYNNYKTYNPNDPTGLDGQKKPYLRSRVGTTGEALVPIAAIPHRVEEQSGGTIINAVYGETPRITRHDGKGNGNNALKLTTASENTIVQNGFMPEPEYDYGGAPITVKVIDPLNVAPGNYVCKFRDYTTAGTEPNGIDTASWTIYRYVNGTIVDQVNSDETIIRENEQVINSDVQKWGISVQIHQEQYKKVGTALAQDEYTEAISSSITYKDSSKLWVRFVEDDDLFYPTNWILDGTYSPTQASDCDPLDPAPHNYLNPCCYADIQGLAPEGMFSSLLSGGIAPQKLVASYCDYSPLAYPYTSYPSARAKARISYAPSIDIVITSDPSKWTRCPVIELGGDPALNVGGQTRGKLRKSPSVDKNGNPDGSGTYGLGWFPGYAIDLESGARLHMAFGENSFLGGENGSDMKWNPTDTYIDGNGIPAFGGQHVIYVYGYQVGTTGSPAYDGVNNWVYDRYMDGSSAELAKAVSSLMWVCNILTQSGHTAGETDVRLSVRVNKEYEDFNATGQNGGKPMYSWSMDDIQTVKGNTERMASVLDLINVVPNPYYAYSEYERTRLDNVVKITNLPDQCTINIYTISGKLVRTYKKDSSVPYQDWDLKNTKGIPIASGVYIIHVDVPGAGEKIVKFFGGVRQVDLENI